MPVQNKIFTQAAISIVHIKFCSPIASEESNVVCVLVCSLDEPNAGHSSVLVDGSLDGVPRGRTCIKNTHTVCNKILTSPAAAEATHL